MKGVLLASIFDALDDSRNFVFARPHLAVSCLIRAEDVLELYDVEKSFAQHVLECLADAISKADWID